MVFHIGISPEQGNIVAYNESSKETFEYFIDNVLFNNIDKVESMFEEIKAKINGDLGCTCICVAWYYNNDIRKKFIEKGMPHGFNKIKIINSETSLYLDLILRAKFNSASDNLIWIVWKENYYLWEKRNMKNAMVKKLQKVSPLTGEDFLKMKEEFGVDKDPNLVIYDNNLCETELKYIKTVFPNSTLFTYRITSPNPPVIKARIMAASNSEVMQYNTDVHLDKEIHVEINGNFIFIFEHGLPLPSEKTVVVPIIKNKDVLEVIAYPFNILYHQRVYYEKIQITPQMLMSGEILYTFKIDENRIFSTYYSLNIKNIESHFNNIYLENSQPLYDIPKKIKTNDSKIYAIGIDLGTSRCFAAVNRRNGIETVGLDNRGERQLPSYVGFDEKNVKCGQIVVNRLTISAKSTIFDSKRIIGRKLEEVIIDENWPFEVINVEESLALKIQSDVTNVVKHPEEVSSVLLKHIKQKVEEFQGKKLDEVVITVPAAFTKEQKLATHIAAMIAGWKIIHLLPEPVAASFAYFINREIPNKSNVLLFDFGGGTLDVCIFKIENNKLEIVGNTGDTNLGGRNFDRLLINYFAKILEKDYQIDVNEKDKSKYRLMEKCMDIKHTLSGQNDASLDVSDFKVNDESHLNVTRQQFEEMAVTLLNKVNSTIRQSLKDANLNSTKINKVLIVGGACRMPMIKKLLEDTFAKAEQCCEENPDEVVAIGAAYYAYHLKTVSESYCSLI